jgi:hypothetical protein
MFLDHPLTFGRLRTQAFILFFLFAATLRLVAQNGQSPNADVLTFTLASEDDVQEWTDLATNRIEVANRAEIALKQAILVGSIFYTLDGSEPSFASAQYYRPLLITNSVTIRAIGYNSDFSQSVTSELSVEVVPSGRLYLSGLPATNLIALSPALPRYPLNSVVTLTALDRDGWVFQHWTNDLTGTNRTMSLVMNASKTVGARYVTRPNMVVGAGAGRIEVSPEWAANNDRVTLTAIPEDGYYFAAWGGSLSDTNNPTFMTISSGTQLVSAAFAPLSPDQVTLRVTMDQLGPVFVSPRKNVYTKGEIVTLSVKFTGWGGLVRFNGWSGDASGFENPLTLTMESSKVVNARFGPVLSWSRLSEANFTQHPNLPAIAKDGTVYLSTLTTLFSGTRDLQTNWVLTTGLLHHSVPAIGDSGTVYVAAANGDAVAVTPEGEILWRFISGDPQPVANPVTPYNRPHPIVLAADETLYVSPYTSSNVYAVKNGQLLRTISPVPQAPTTQRTPVIGPDGTLYLPAGSRFSAQSPSGQEKWTAPYPRPVAIDSSGRLYSISSSNIVSLDFNGNHLWTTSLDAPARELLIGEAGRIFARSDNGLAAFETNGTLLWTNGTVGHFAPLADGGVLVVNGVAVTQYLNRVYQYIDANGKSGPAIGHFVGWSFRQSLFAGNPVVSESGDIYAEWTANLYLSSVGYVGSDIPLAHSSWPLPWGRNNTGRAIRPVLRPALSVTRSGTNLLLRPMNLSAAATLQSSPDLKQWSDVEPFTYRSSKTVQPDGQHYYRLRQN